MLQNSTIPSFGPHFLTNAPHFATPAERPIIRTSFLSNAPHSATPESPSFGSHFSPMPLILGRPLSVPHSDLISLQCPPHFTTPLSAISFLTNLPNFATGEWRVRYMYLSRECEYSCLRERHAATSPSPLDLAKDAWNISPRGPFARGLRNQRGDNYWLS